MILIDKRDLRNCNYSHQILFHHVALENLDFHQSCLFPYNILVFVTEEGGRQENYIKCKEINSYLQLKKGHYYLIPNGLQTEYKLTGDIDFLTMHFSIEIYPGIDIFSGIRRFFTDRDIALTAHFRDIFDEENQHRVWFRLQAAVSELCMKLWKPEFSGNLNSTSKYERVFQEIVQHCNARQTVAQVAENFGMTQEAFSRKFRSDMGEPPKKFIQKALLREILARLSQENMSTKIIADELKFSSEFYLQKFFKKQMGMTIGEYRKRFRGVSENR